MNDDGGPAFPVQDCASWQFHGMNLRDYFAAHATDAEVEGHLRTLTLEEATAVRTHLRAHARYMHADAMLAARKGAES